MFKKEKIDISTIDGKKRDSIFKMNISVSFFTKLISILISFILVPLTINYLNQEMYGVWITLLSLLSWFSFCDIGLGNGLRNKLTECLSNNDIKNAKKYVSTAYISIFTIVMVIFIPLLIVIQFVSWNKVLNTDAVSNGEIIKLVYIVTIFFLINFVVSIINQIYYAYQKSMLVGFIQITQNIIMLLAILLIRNLPNKSIVYLGLIYGISTLTTNVAFSIMFFSKNKEIRPSIKDFSKEKVFDILSLGMKFFVMQISAIIIFTTDNILITQLIGPEYVTKYNIVQKIFGVLMMVHAILITPLWSAYTEAYTKKDYAWIKKILLKLKLLMVPITGIALIIYILFDFIMKIWIKQSLNIPKSLVILVAIYTLVSIWNNIYAYFLNGIGLLKVSLNLSIIGAIINIPLAIYFAKNLGLGMQGIILSNILCLLMSSIVQPIQTYCIINNKLKGSIFYK